VNLKFNLLSNACKFTKGGEVKLKARRLVDGRDWIELAVADSGLLGSTATMTFLRKYQRESAESASCEKNFAAAHSDTFQNER
jgi:hypothetical protein